ALDIDELDRIAQVLAVPISKFFATADDDRGPTGGAQSRLGESNPRPSHYKAPSRRSNGSLSIAPVTPIKRPVAPVIPFTPGREKIA
ncbi:immunity repressor, partial [Mycolicibacterium canariasense]